jgi:hypothetical protein
MKMLITVFNLQEGEQLGGVLVKGKTAGDLKARAEEDIIDVLKILSVGQELIL